MISRSNRPRGVGRIPWSAILILLAGATLWGILSPGRAAESPDASGATAAVTEDAGHGQPDAASEGAHEGGHGAGHTDPVAPVLIVLTLILAGAKLGGDLFERIGQPAVLGELIAGLVLGNVGYALGDQMLIVLREGPIINELMTQVIGGTSWLEAVRSVLPGTAFEGPDAPGPALAHMLATQPYLVKTAQAVDIASRIGVILLLFLVGLESSLPEMLKVGVSSLLVALVGVVVPFGLGFLVSELALPEATHHVHLFIGATLCATSVGITARVLKDLGKLQTVEAKIILGAAVIDDVLGLVILAVVAGIIQSGGFELGTVTAISLKALVFLVGVMVIGSWITPYLTRMISKMRVEGAKLIYVLCIAFVLSWLANEIGLATIVGAFAAGLILTEVQFKTFARESRHLEELLEPITAFLVPIFFVTMGIQVKLETFADTSVLLIAVGLTVAAIAGKQVCGLAVGKSIDRLSIGVGMVPRGEVGLIFASIGRGLGVVTDSVFSAVVIMVILTTLMTPPVLKLTLSRWERKQQDVGIVV